MRMDWGWMGNGPDPDDIARLSEEMRRKGMPPRQLERLRAHWDEACLDPMKRGILREAPDAKSGTHDTPAQLPEPQPPEPVREKASSLLELLDRSRPFPEFKKVIPPEDEGL